VSRLTLCLLCPSGKGPSRRDRRVTLLAEVADRFVNAYGVPSLGNRSNPVDELFYILLSARTPEVNYVRCYRALKEKFPRLTDLAAAPVPRIARCIRDAGLANKRARQFKVIARTLLRQLGSNPARGLRRMRAEEAYAFLHALPGVAAKSAACVMMYSLGFDVFPVDVHARRIGTRLGVLPEGLDHRAAQAKLPAFVPDGRSKELHVGFVIHGRTVCLPRRPACERCMLADLCRFGRAELKNRGGKHGQRRGNR